LYLKRLELVGFKTFANRTEFAFNTGITAIVGPNGSGKSNVADAVRWVLGEQATRPLRIKRTEDVIFAGSTLRPRLGMAEASLTLDNADGRLPLDYSEVTLTRRAYRSGDNEYLINKSRVRLRDMVELLLAANLGQNAYTVIGQGTVDAALSLHPEERRGLFEEAADIKRYQGKRQDALDKLAATEQNLVRVGDLVAELGPRLQALQEQARRTQEHERLTGELRGLLAAWYGHRWQQAHLALADAQVAAEEQQRQLAAAQAETEQLRGRLSAVRTRQQTRRATLAQMQSDLALRRESAAALEREAAVAAERLSALTRQREDVAQQLATLEASLTAEQEAWRALEGEVTRLSAAAQAHRAALQITEGELAARQAARRGLETQLATAQTAAFNLATRLADQRNRLAQLAERRQELAQELAAKQQAAVAAETAAARASEQITTQRAQITDLDGERQALTTTRDRLQAEVATSLRQQAQQEAALARLAAERQALQTHLDLLTRFQDEGTGYAAGVRTVLAARLHGVIGTVASLLQVPPELETAIEAALGTHLQDIVVERWADAVAAIELLQRTGGGRATFLPLDTIRVARGRGTSAEGKEGNEVLGWAVDLVKFEPRYAPIFDYLLGNVLIVRSLVTPFTPVTLATIVTLSGQVFYPFGALTGGSPREPTASGMLARERERRELPAQLAAAAAAEGEATAALATERERHRHLLNELAETDRRWQALVDQREAQTGELAAVERQAERQAQEAGWWRTLEKQLAAEAAALADKEASIRQDLEAVEAEHGTALAQATALREQLTGLATDDLAARLAEARTALALAEQAAGSQAARLEERRSRAAQLAGQLATSRTRWSDLAARAEVLAAQVATQQSDLTIAQQEVEGLAAQLAPAAQEIADLEAEEISLGEQEAAARARFIELELAHSRAALEAQRAQDELASLRRQIEEEEIAVEEIDRVVLALPEQLRLQLNGGAPPVSLSSSLPLSPLLSPDQLKRRLDQLRGQIRALGAVNPNAIAEYEEALSRYTFLTTQADDLQQAVKSLRTVIAELDELMHRRFEETFQAVAAEFKRYFTTLFAGGTARLVLTDPDDPQSTGVEIIAQPPGKRLQSLALLSGGERALTAVALLFALLSVSPTPFCLLDEVDAALDEANIGRFCEVLQSLVQRTQFIVITHNRGTMEIADALYGVSMGEDSVSRVLSLKL
jgi:chromosome segregation protein